MGVLSIEGLLTEVFTGSLSSNSAAKEVLVV
jgi:hypothetical protein